MSNLRGNSRGLGRFLVQRGHLMKPEDITLRTTSRQFHYETLSRQIEECNDIKELKEQLRSWIRLYMKQQETLGLIGVPGE